MTSEKIFHAAFWVLLGGVILMRLYFSLQVRRGGERLMPNKGAIEREGRRMFAGRVVAFLFLVVFLVAYALNPSWMSTLSIPFPEWLRWSGFALGIASLVLWTWTQAELGKHWSAQLQLRKKHRLVTTGPYAHVRHPLYAIMIVWAAAVALVTSNWVFAIFGIISSAGLAVRVPREEKMMIEEFGGEYEKYMQKTGRFLPKW